MKKIFAIILSLLMVLPMCMAVSAEGETVPYDSSWEISATSQLGTSVMKAFDGDLTTNWHTNYTAEGGKILSHDECPHVITVNFGGITLHRFLGDCVNDFNTTITVHGKLFKAPCPTVRFCYDRGLYDSTVS